MIFFRVGNYSGGRVDIFSGGVDIFSGRVDIFSEGVAIFWEGLRFFREGLIGLVTSKELKNFPMELGFFEKLKIFKWGV